MGILFNWLDNEESTIHIRFENTWTSEDFHKMVIRVRDMIQSKRHLVHVIADFLNSVTPSSTLLVEIPFAVRQMQANQGAIIILTGNETVRHLVNTAASMHQGLRQRLYIVESLDMAERILLAKQRRAITR